MSTDRPFGDLGVVDMMLGIPSEAQQAYYRKLAAQARDAESAEMKMPAEYMFKNIPGYLPEGADPVETVLGEMDHCGVEIALTGAGAEVGERALREHPDRFKGQIHVDPNDIGGSVRLIRERHDELGIVAVSSFPAGCEPQVPINGAGYYPIYQTCVDLGLPMIINAGVAGPRVPSECQHVMHLDQVCYDFPDLTLIMCHGAEPWEDLAVKLMLKWPGLHYMTSAFAPKYYPKAIIDYANTRGADKIIYAGYYPMGLSLRRIFDELPDVPLKDEVRPKFLRENAMRVLGLDS